MVERVSKFLRNAGSDASHGANFEWETTLLCYLECEVQHQIWKRTGNSGVKTFFVANNVQGVGAFDDVVFRVEYVEEGEAKTKLIFIQCKHVEGETNERKFQNYLGGKQIRKYFESFIKVRTIFEDALSSKTQRDVLDEDIQNSQNLKNMFNCTFENCEFWFVSNIDLKNLHCNYLQLEQKQESSFLSSGLCSLSKEYKLLYNESCKVIFDSKDNRMQASEFCKSFRIFLNVDDTNARIDNVNQKLMEKDTIMDFTLKETLRESLLKETKFILKSETLLNEETEMFRKIHFFLHLKKSSEDSLNKRRHSLTLNTTEALDIISHFQINNRTKYKRLRELKIFQAFLQANKDNLCMVINTEIDLRMWHLARQTFVYKNINNTFIFFESYLILTVEKEENEIFVQIVHTPESQESYTPLQQISTTEMVVLENYKTSFQGYEIQMKELCGNWKDVLDEDAICDILENKTFKIGMKLQHNSDFYLPRKLKMKVLNEQALNKIKSSITSLHKNKYLLFVHGGTIIDKTNGNSYQFFESIEEAYKYSTELIDPNDLSTSFCTCLSDEIKLQYSIGRDVNFIEEQIVDEDYVLKSNKITILSDVAGMGKSTSMVKMASDYKALNNSHWVLFIELGKCSKIFEQAKNIDNQANAVDFLASKLLSYEKIQKNKVEVEEHGNIEQKLIINACLETGKVAIFFDGFDELSPSATEMFIKFLLALHRTKTARIFVSSRQKSVGELELATLQDSIQFLEIKSEEIENCLLGIWKQRIANKGKLIRNEKLKEIANKMKNAFESRENFIHKVLGIPLQIRMLADAYYEEMIEYCESDISVPFNFNLELLNLYERFIQSQVVHYYTDKLNVDWTSLQEQQQNRHIREKLRDSPELACSLIIPSLIKDNTKDMSEIFLALRDDLGLITDDTCSPPLFLHRTIAEYLAAKYIVTNVLLQNIDYQIVQMFVYILTANEYEVLRKFINSFLDENNLPKYFENIGNKSCLSEFELHFKPEKTPYFTAASEGNIKLFKAFFGSNKTSIDQKSAWGETALNYACLRNKPEIVEFLLNHDCSINELDEDGSNALYYATEAGHVPVMELLLKREKSLLNMQNCIGTTCLHLASSVGNIEAAEFLLNEGCSIDIHSNDGNTAFHFAAERNHVKILELLLRRNESMINLQNDVGQTPLHVAAWVGSIEAAEFLVYHDCFVSELDTEGKTVLHYAAYKGQIQILDFVLQCKDSLLNMKDRGGGTALYYACQNGKINIVRYLLSKNCSVTECDNLGKTALHSAAEKNRFEIIDLLVQYNTSILNMQNNNKQTALHLACSDVNTEAVVCLLNHDCSVTDCDINGDTTFHYAARRHTIHIMELLLEREPSLLNIPNNEGLTPLHLACMEGKTDGVQFLLNLGCSVADRDISGCNAFHIAAERGHIIVMELLLKYDESLINSRDNHGVTPVQKARFHTETIKFLLNHGCTVNNRDNDGDTVFNAETLCNNVEAMEILLQYSESLLNGANDQGETPLHQACRLGNGEATTFLLAVKKCSRIQYNNDGNTPFHEATKNGHAHVMEMFLKNDKSFSNMKNEHGFTSLHIACFEGKIEAVKLLLKHECSINEFDDKGDTAFHKAALKGYCEILELLLDRDKSLANIRNNDGFLPLDLALSNVQVEAANLLLEFGGSKTKCIIC